MPNKNAVVSPRLYQTHLTHSGTRRACRGLLGPMAAVSLDVRHGLKVATLTLGYGESKRVVATVIITTPQDWRRLTVRAASYVWGQQQEAERKAAVKQMREQMPCFTTHIPGPDIDERCELCGVVKWRHSRPEGYAYQVPAFVRTSPPYREASMPSDFWSLT